MNYQWPPQVASAMHQFADAAQDAPSLAAVVERNATKDVAVSVRSEFSQPSIRRPLVLACAAIVIVIGIVVVTSGGETLAPADESVPVTEPSVDETVPETAPQTTPAQPTASAFAAAIKASGVLTSPTADEVTQATDGDLYRQDYFSQTQVSAAGNYVSMLKCRVKAVSTCGSGWVYVTGVVDGGEVRGGLLGEATQLDLHLLDDRYFVVSESSPNAEAPASAWLIDAVSGKSGTLSWRAEPTTLISPEQALLLCEESKTSSSTNCAVTEVWDADHEETFTDEVSLGGTTVTSTYVVTGAFIDVPTAAALPKVVDARDGTIRPLAMPDNVVAGMPVAQDGTGRIWIGTEADGNGLGLAYSDDGGANWTQVTLPEGLPATAEELARAISSGDDLLEIAADGDRVAVAESWGGDTVYVSGDAGMNWTTATADEPGGNGAHLYILADGRLVLMWSMDNNPSQLLVSTGSDWAALERVGPDVFATETQSSSKYFSVNRAGIAMIATFIPTCVTPCTADADEAHVLDKIDFSTDLTNWSTIEGLSD